MECVFIAGSRALSKLNAPVKARLDNIVKRNFAVFVGDANGIDKAVQKYFAERQYPHVMVYCMDDCRNNIGNWPIRRHVTEPGSRHDRQYYGIKDLAMANDASCGFMIWDGLSKGTFANVVNLLKAQKKVLLYSAPKKEFFTIRTGEELIGILNASGIKDANGYLASLARSEEAPSRLHFAKSLPLLF